jgi:hypothetical protein
MHFTGSPQRSRSDPLAAVGGALLVAWLAPAAAIAQPAILADPDPAPAAAAAPDAAKSFFSEPKFFTRGIDLTGRFAGEGGGHQSNGFYPDFSNMVSGSGWISAGPGYRHWLFNDTAIFDTSAALSWRSYKTVQGRFELPNLASDRLAIGTQALWQDATQISYFGVGSETTDAMRSEFRMKTTDVVGYATVRPARRFEITGRVGWLQSPQIEEPGGTFKRGNPSAESMFPDDPVFLRGTQPDFLYTEATFTADTRDHRSHPTGGGVYRLTLAKYSDRDGGAFSHRRYEAEAAQFVPVAKSRVVFALHGWFVNTETNPGDTVPFYLMPTLGDGATLRSFTGYRFHDNNALVLNFETRFAIWEHLDLAGYVGAGNVAAKLGDLNVDKHEYGAGLRVHTGRATLLRLDATHGPEGWRIIFRQSDPFHLTRLKRKTASAPIQP